VPAGLSSLLDGLTGEQQEVVVHEHGPMVVFAGPGAGKTKTICSRAAYLVASGRALGEQILCVTFTNRAAGEMRERLNLMLGDLAAGITVCTLHSLCARIMRTYAEAVGRNEKYSIYDEADLGKVIDYVLADKERVQVQAQIARTGTNPAKALINEEISAAKAKLLTPAQYAEQATHEAAPVIAALWEAVDEQMQLSNALSFEDLIYLTTRLLLANPPVRDHYRQRWLHLLVDEYQDTNYSQDVLIQLLSGGPGGSTVAVGDDDQAIYSWRFAEVDNLLDFHERFPDTKTTTLRRNFRCRAEILDVATRMVQRNDKRHPKALIAVKGAGGFVQHYAFASDSEEAQWVAMLVADAIAKGVSPEEILVCFRTARVGRLLQPALAARRIPFRIVGSLGLYERAEIKDAVAYLTLLSNPSDAIAFRRAIGAPKRGVGDQTAMRVVEHARHYAGDIVAACLASEHIPGLTKRMTDALVGFGQRMSEIRAEAMSSGRSLGHIVAITLNQRGGLVEHLKNREDEAAVQSLRDLWTTAAAFATQHADATLAAFLETLRLVGSEEVSADTPLVSLSTIHRAKGAEATLVVVMGCEDRALPSWRAIEEGSLDEERRCAYVAMTRAKEWLYLTSVAHRNGRATDGVSRFLREASLA
jgi:DNA helicase-2/ATP-dependent DNA helicase PcrA